MYPFNYKVKSLVHLNVFEEEKSVLNTFTYQTVPMQICTYAVYDQ